ncbi:exodeoxyribonuclease VII small subunit [Parapedobacter sp. 2B3]|uniref:exodeoxyribonuclease VII small subunit n=1 Tax=Parapedobacter sp. 2B3 TaxID=3342381 RepID=UPI0035B66B71
MDKPYTYTDAYEELQAIVSEIEHGEISVDELSEKVKRATLLITACKAKLTATETEVKNILAGLSSDHTDPTDTEG